MNTRDAKLVEIRMEAHGRGKVVIDGVEVEGVVGVEVCAAPDRENTVVITLQQFVKTEAVVYEGPACVTSVVQS